MPGAFCGPGGAGARLVAGWWPDADDGSAGLIAGRRTNEAGSTNNLRADVLRVLGVLKAATADQIQRLSSPHLTYRHTLKKTAAARKEASHRPRRGAINDLRRHGLAVDAGRTREGEELRLLTKDGLAAAGLELDRGRRRWAACPRARAAPMPRTR